MIVKIFSSTNCPSCERVREFFDKNGLQYEEILIDKNPVARKYLVKKFGVASVPVIQKGDDIFVGYQPRVLLSWLKGVNE